MNLRLGLLIVLVPAAAAQAEETKKSAGWLKAIGQTMTESPSKEDENPARVAGSRGLTDGGTDSEPATDASPATEESSEPESKPEPPKKKKLLGSVFDLLSEKN